ncbi:lipoprotein [soil metagenome]
MHAIDRLLGPTLRRVVAGCLLALASGCAIVANVPPGISGDDLESRYGKPAARHPLPGGAYDAEYPTAPYGQFCWMVRVVDGKVTQVRQVLTDQEFATVNIGTDNRESIRAHFGPPAEVLHLSFAQREVWSYRMKQSGVFPVLMNVQFDSSGVAREVFSSYDALFDSPGGDFN